LVVVAEKKTKVPIRKIVKLLELHFENGDAISVKALQMV
jgi:hypothetical protein